MRCLFITNIFPPTGQGGYEEWCQEVALGFIDRGHEIVVLTSRPEQGVAIETEPTWVYRDLYPEMTSAANKNAWRFFTKRKSHEQANLARLRQFIEKFNPDALLVWGMWNLHRSLPALAEQLLPGRVVYYIGDYWLTLPSQHELYWQAPAQSRIAAAPKYVLGSVAGGMLSREKRPVLQLEHVLFPTEFMQDELARQGIKWQQSKIITGAVDLAPYKYRPPRRPLAERSALNLLYVGRLTAEKGVHTAIDGLAKILGDDRLDVHLNIVGSGSPVYEEELRQQVLNLRLQDHVTFAGQQPKPIIREFYAQADILVFTSIWPEPFGRVLIEAMASGVAVVGTATGGAAELLQDEETALTYPPNDSDMLAAQIARLATDDELWKKIVANGHSYATSRYTIDRMVGEIESYLLNLVN